MNNSAYVVMWSEAERTSSSSRFADELRQRHAFKVLVDTPRLLVLGLAGAPHLLLPRCQGILWGHLFSRAASDRIVSDDGDALANGAAEQFLEDYWGGYVAIRTRCNGLEILRDPSGAVACYHAEVDGTHIVTSRPDLLFSLGLMRPAIDFTIVAQSLAYSDLRPATTALRGVSEILPGVAISLDGGKITSRCAWSPWAHVDGNSDTREFTPAVAKLRDVIKVTLRAWGGALPRPMLEISGGLDSSIVAAGFGTEAGTKCLTFGPAIGDPDERPYARAVATHLGLDLVELMPMVELVDLTRSDAHHLPRPCARGFSQALDRPIQDLAADLGVDAFVGGGGGDSVFCHLQSALPVVDRLMHEGPTKGVLDTAREIASLSRTNTWQVLLVAAKRWGRRSSRMPKPRPNRFLAESVWRSLPWPAGNPWLEAPPGVPPAKKRHVWSLIGIQNHLEGYGREAMAPLISPLLSQPIVETCLGIPSWLWSVGGNNRALAREAFRGMLPNSIIDRRTKGGFDTFVVRLIESNQALIRTMLTEGTLAREGLLDGQAIADFLNSRLADNEGVAELLALVDAEAWVSSWQSAPSYF
ncbi:asparagine synthase-related protein [Sphingomonas soli]|uniref:asparagine synthase-related protein n=1 Tax=Sphingomonas soli TaxID=266127 RepID=UPI00082EEC04|nr:asparagine synthetase B family protein [Sphingomonas soli]